MKATTHLTKRWKIKGGVPAELLYLEKVERKGLERFLTTLREGNVRNGLSKLLAKSEPLGRHIAVNTAELIERTTHICKLESNATLRNPASVEVASNCLQPIEKIGELTKEELSGSKTAKINYLVSIVYKFIITSKSR